MSHPRDVSRREFLLTAGAAGLTASLSSCAGRARTTQSPSGANHADLILTNARITTLDPARPEAAALAVRDGRFIAVGAEHEIVSLRGPRTVLIDAGARRVIPGLNDSHLHVIRAGLNYNLELRWDGVDSLADALWLLREQARVTPPPQWVRVVGGWSELQFKERRLPTLAEINDAAPDTPVFVLHLYDRALLNRAALRAVGYTRHTPTPTGAFIERDTLGEPTGLLVARPNPFLLYKTLSLGPALSRDDQMNSSRHFMRELNRLGVTSAIDAGGGFQNYPEDYAVIEDLHRRKEMSVRIAYNLFAQKAGHELQDLERWATLVRPGQGDAIYRHNGAGENLVMSAADFEDFLEPRPDLAPEMEGQLTEVVSLLVRNRWPFRLHATYDESISRFLDVFERVNREIPFDGLRWFFDHAETVSDANLERIRALRGAVAVQHRMAFQGEYFINRYGAEAARRTPPIRKMLQMGIPVGAGTDGTRVASYNPWVAFSWLATGRTVGGTPLYTDDNLLSREEALRLLTSGSARFSGEQDVKGAITPGMHADFAVLTQDCMTTPDRDLARTTSALTAMGGKVVYATADFAPHAPPPLPISPAWSPAHTFPNRPSAQVPLGRPPTCACAAHTLTAQAPSSPKLWGPVGCDCFAF